MVGISTAIFNYLPAKVLDAVTTVVESATINWYVYILKDYKHI